MSTESQLLPVMEMFYTLQGEGRFAGSAAFFIRLAGCDVGCVWCDVKESWDAGKHELISIDDIVAEASTQPAEIVVITGGEPAMYNLEELCNRLLAVNKRIHLETSGVYPVTGFFHHICFSPKKFKNPHESIYTKCHELKVIIFNKSDFQFAEQHAAKVNASCDLYIQPEWGKVDFNSAQIVEYVKASPKWKISVQTHKYLNIP